MAKRDNYLAARALAEWSLSNFKYASLPKISETYKVTTRTIENWLYALKEDSELSALYKENRELLLTGNWAAKIDETLSTIIDRMKALSEGSNSLPEVTLAFEKVADVSLAKEILSHEFSTEEGREIQDRTEEASEVQPVLN